MAWQGQMMLTIRLQLCSNPYLNSCACCTLDLAGMFQHKVGHRCIGEGFVQSRRRSCTPVPQTLLQLFQELQVDQPPSTMQKEIKNKWTRYALYNVQAQRTGYRTTAQTHGRTHQRTHERTNYERTNERTNEWINWRANDLAADYSFFLWNGMRVKGSI